MTATLIIASGAYCGSELEAEFGRLPPAFLPVGNRRLYTRQHAALPAGFGRVILSIPEDFAPEPMDLALLEARGIETVPVPLGLSLGQSLVYVMNVTAAAAGPVSILHGDTLIEGVEATGPDVVSVDVPQHGYAWGYVARTGDRVCDILLEPPAEGAAEALSGFFAFSDGPLLVKHITRKGGDFLRGIAAYAGEKALRTVSAARWLDFGHLNTYHHSRRQMTTEREFNRLSPSRRRVEKSGTQPHKIEAEARWFATLPEDLRLHAPAYLGMRRDGEAVSYAIEYLHLPTLSDLFVFGRLSRDAWGRVFAGCDEFLTACAAHRAPPGAAGDAALLYGPKTLARLEAFGRARGLDMARPGRLDGLPVPSPLRMAELATAAIPPRRAGEQTLVHGDFCFSNILYDARAEMVRVIDPRGLDGAGAFSVHGDLRYDLGKLFHSVVGRYDHILAGAARLERDGPLDFRLSLPDGAALRAVEAEFLSRRFGGLSPEDAAPAIGVLLFLSMLPLHADDPLRQDTLLANAMRLFLRLDGRSRRDRAA